MIALYPEILIVVWFPESYSRMLKDLMLLPDQQTLMLSKDLQPIRERMVVFAEHYPIADVEQQVFKQLGLTNVPVLSSLDESLFSYFGGERLVAMMEKIGMHDNEVIAHGFVTKAIANAQQKISEKVKSEVKADSQEKWFRNNLGAVSK